MPTPHLNLLNEPPKLSVRSPDAFVYLILFFIMIIHVIPNLIGQSASVAGLQLLESFSPFSATWPPNHLDWLILFFSIIIPIIISQYNAVAAGRALLETCSPLLPNWPSLKEFWNTQGKGRDETKGNWVAIRQNLDTFAQKVATRLSIVLSTTKSTVEIFAQVVSKPFKRSQSGKPKVIRRLRSLATWWAFLYLPTRVGAYELKSEDDFRGYGPAAIGAALFMFMLLVLKVHDSVRGYINSLVDGGRRLSDKLLFLVLVIVLLAAMVMILALPFQDVYYFKENVSIAGLIYLGSASISVALISRMPGRCHTCKKSPCICSTGSGTGTGTDSSQHPQRDHLDIEKGSLHYVQRVAVSSV